MPRRRDEAKQLEHGDGDLPRDPQRAASLYCRAARFGDADTGTLPPAPHLGEHGEQVLRELGYDEARIAALVASAALQLPKRA